jgi:hypothetical protein
VGGLKFLIEIIGAPIFKISVCGGTPKGVKELRNSVEKWTASSFSKTVSTE